MGIRTSRPAVVLWIALAASMGGCTAGEDPATQAQAEPRKVYEVTAEDIEKAFDDLSPDDRELARAQKTCPVSDELLGSMDTPVKLTVQGRDLFICCRGCDKTLLAYPEKYLAKLDGND